MVSLLIPVYNYDIVALVYYMKNGIKKVNEFGEIIIGDDGSSPEFKRKYQSLTGEKVKLISYEKNIGRAAIKNRLAGEAKGDHLLFIDADTMVPGTADAWLRKWIKYLSKAPVICGGVLYKESQPGDPDKLLRWRYGKKREQLKSSERNKNPHANFSTFNVLFDKSVFSRIRFNEELKQYGHEDTLMGYQLRKADIGILHIDNGLVHEGLETNREYLNKTKLGIENLSKLYGMVTDRGTFSETVRLLRNYNILELLRLNRILAGIFIRFRERMEIRLDSSKPSLILFGFYKICMFCTFREIHRRKKVVPIFNPVLLNL